VLLPEPICFPFVRVTEKLDLDRFVAESVFAKECYSAVQTISRRSVFVE
jgi:hypothetical protein